MRASGGSIPVWSVLALGLGVLLAPTTVDAQLLDRTSRTVRSGASAGATRSSSSGSSSSGGRRSSGGVLDRTSSTVRSGGGSSSSSSSSTSSPPRRDATVVRPPARAVQVSPPVRRDAYPQYDPAPDRPVRTADPDWDDHGVVGWGGGTTVVIERSTVIESDVDATVQRDPMLGGSAGVRATGPIGIPPPRPAEPLPNATAPSETVVVVAALEEKPEPTVRAVVGMDAGYVIGNLARGTLFARVALPYQLEAWVDYAGFLEPNEDGFDALALGRLGVGYAFVDDGSSRVALGVALRHFQDWIGSRFGIDGRLSVEVEIVPSIVLSAEGSIGTVGDAYVVTGRATLGGRFDSIEVFAGYEQIALQSFDPELGGVDLGGPLAGVRVWID